MLVPNSRPRRAWLHLGSTLLLLVIALAVRGWMVDVQSLSMDEEFDLATARRGVAGVLAAEDRFPPLYHTLLAGWWKAFPNDATGRWFSVACGLALVLVIAEWARAISGPAAHFWAGMFCAVSPFAVWYSVESRVYALYLVLAAASMWQLWLAVAENRRRNWIAWAVFSLAGAYTHYYFGLLLVIEALLLLAARGWRWPKNRRCILAIGCVTILSLPDLWFLNHDLTRSWGFARDSSFSLAVWGYTLVSFFSGYTLGPSLGELHQLPPAAAIPRFAPWLILAGLPAAILIIQSLASSRANLRRWLLVLTTLTLTPALFVGLISLRADFGYNVRHVLWSFVPLAVTVGLGIARGRPRWLAGGCAVLLFATSLIALNLRMNDPHHRNEDVRATAVFLKTQTPAPVFVISGYLDRLFDYYLPKSWPVVGLPGATEDVSEAIEQHLDGQKQFWLAYSRPFHGDPEGKLLAELQLRYRLELVEEFPGVKLYQGIPDVKRRIE